LKSKDNTKAVTFPPWTSESIHEEYLNYASHGSWSPVHIQDEDECTCEKCFTKWWETEVAPPHVTEALNHLFLENVKN
jgi:hypothetical protein